MRASLIETARSLLSHVRQICPAGVVASVCLLPDSFVTASEPIANAQGTSQVECNEGQDKEGPLNAAVPQVTPPYARWIFAKHAIIFEGDGPNRTGDGKAALKVVDWNHVKDTIEGYKTARQDYFATFYITDGYDRVRSDELSKASDGWIAEITGIGSRGKYDRVRTQDDLRPDPKLRMLGRVFTPNGKPAASAQVIVLPGGHQRGRALRIGRGRLRGRIKEPHEETRWIANGSGGFAIYPDETDELILILHESGYGYFTKDEVTKVRTLRLTEWANFSGKVDQSKGQQAALLEVDLSPAITIQQWWFGAHGDGSGNYSNVVMPAVRDIRAYRWPYEHGGNYLVRKFSPKPGDLVAFDISSVTPNDKETGAQQKAERRMYNQVRREGKYLVWENFSDPATRLIRFGNSDSVELYAKQLAALDVALAAYFPETGRLLFLTNANTTKPTITPMRMQCGQNVGKGKDGGRGASDLRLFKKAGIDATGAKTFHVYPAELKKRLAKLEQEYAETKKADQIQRTFFEVRKVSEGYDIAVSRQVVKKPSNGK